MRVLVTGHTGLCRERARPAAGAGRTRRGRPRQLSFRGLRARPRSGFAASPERRRARRDRGGPSRLRRGLPPAELSNDALGNFDPELTYEINHRASVRLARAAKGAGVGRFLFASSCSIYGVTGGDELVDESAPLKPLTPYAESKARVEDDLVALAGDGFSPVLSRNATIYGYSPRFRADLVLNNLVAWAHVSGQTRVTSDGTPWRPVVHVEDVARAAFAALATDRGAVRAEAFNVGSGRDNCRLRDLADVVEQTVPGASFVITGESGPDPRSYRVDFSKVERVLPAFRPAWDPRRGARELYDAFVRFELSRERLENDFTRLARLSELTGSGRLDETLRWRGPERAAASA